MAVNPLAIGGGVVAAAAVVGGGLYAGGVFSGGDKNSGNTGGGNSRIEKEDWEVGMSSWHSLSEDNGYDSAGYTSKYGETHKKYLVGVTTKNGETNKNNNEWWKWVFKNRYEKNKSKAKGKFQNLTKADDDTDSLKAACKDAYKADTNNTTGKIKTNETEVNSNDKFLESQIWLFCSPAKEKIQSITDAAQLDTFAPTSEDVYGNIDKAKKDLVSTESTSKGNKWFWYEKSQKHKAAGTSVQPQIQDSDVKKWCKEAYGKATADSAFEKTNVYTWCSMSGSAPQ